MDEYQLIYISSFDSDSNKRQFNDIFEQISNYSLSHNINGFLLYSEHSLLQILEGKRKDVLNVFNSISKYLIESEHLILSEKAIKKRSLQNPEIHSKQIEQAEFNDLYNLSILDIEHFKKKLVVLAAESKNEELKKSFEMLQLHKELVDIHSSLCITDANEKINYVNDLYCNLSGYTRDELIGQNHRILKSDVHDNTFYENLYQTIQDDLVWRGEICNKRKDGGLYWINASIVPRLDVNGIPIEYYSIGTDITSQKYTELALMEKAEQIRTILELAGDGIHVLDENGNVIECSQSFADSLGYTKQEILKLNVRDWDALIPADELPSILKKLLISCDTFETKHKRRDNTLIDVEINAKGITLKEKNYIYASSRDITDRLKEQRKIKKMASTDQLTGLANRHKFVEHFEYILNIAQREKKQLVLILADLNKFKKINDQYGHHTGDEVLKHIANLLIKNCRQYDLAARIGGDEFAVLLIHADIPSAIRYVEEILLHLKQSLTINGEEILIGLSFGIAVYPEHAQTIEDLFKKADLALYNVKKKGKSGYFYL